MRRDSEAASEAATGEIHRLALGRGWSDPGLIEVFEPMVSAARQARLREVVEGRLASVTVVMDAPHDPHNGAALIRTCDALGVLRMHVVPRVEPFLISRVVTKGSEQWVDVVQHATPRAALEAMRSAGFTLVATHPEGELVPEALGRIPRVALVLGNEHDGICAELEQGVDHSVRIPMRGFVESLNVSVSAAVLLSRACENRPGDLTPADKLAFYARWLLESVPRSREIMEALPPR